MKNLASAFPSLAGLAVASLVSGCMVGPDYTAPVASAPAAYRWAASEPATGTIAGEWWLLYQDPVLSDLIARSLARNNDLHAALARVDQARAAARVTRAALLPSLAAAGDFEKFHLSSTTANVFPVLDGNDMSAGLDLSYEIDFWGRIRRSVAASRAEAVASADDFENLRLGISTSVAIEYFSLRALDAEIDVLNRAIALRQDSVSLTGARARSHVTSDIDLSRAKTELSSARAQLVQVERRRSQTELALAILCGEQPSGFRLAAQPPLASPPPIPAALPSSLLEHRPDIAAAERRVASASERIGAAKAAFFPTVLLTAGGGFESGDTADLLRMASRFLEAGPSVTVPLFTAGRTQAEVDANRARLAEAQAGWSQSVLVAFKEVEDALRDQQLLANLQQQYADSRDAAQDVAELSTSRYRNGLVDYLDVVDAQRSELEAERQVVETAGQRFIASVELVKALGGGWRPGEPALSQAIRANAAPVFTVTRPNPS